MSALQSVPKDLKKTFIRQITLFKFVGIDFFDDPQTPVIRRYGKFMFFIAMFVPLILSQFLYIFLTNITHANFLEVASAVPCVTLCVQDTVKLVVIILKKDKIRDVIMQIAELWPTDVSDCEKKADELKTCLRRLKIFDDIFFVLFSVVGLIAYQLTPIIIMMYSHYMGEVVNFLLPFQMYVPWKLTTMYHYLALYIYIAISSSILHVCIYVTSDFLLVTLTSNVSTLLRLLQIDIKHVIKPQKRSQKNSASDYSEIKSFIKMHQKLLRLIDQLNNIFGLLILIQVAFSSVILCFFGFLAMISSGIKALNHFISVCGVVFIIFNLSWPGQLLYETSTGIADAAYESLWYESHLEYRKIIFFIIARSQKPGQLSALGFSRMTLVGFSKILSSAWSYLSLLRQVFQEIDT